MFQFELGDRVKDCISGFAGVIVARTEWLNGCKRYMVQAEQLYEGKPVDPIHIDQEQLVRNGDRVIVVKNETGGDRPAPARARDPSR
jgi:hypothetical protein